MAARNALFKYFRVNVAALPQLQNPTGGVSQLIRRHFSEEARASFLEKSEVTDRVLNAIKTVETVDQSKVTPTAHFQKDLGLDSLDAVDVLMALEDEFSFEIPDEEADKINSLELAIDYIASHPKAK